MAWSLGKPQTIPGRWAARRTKTRRLCRAFLTATLLIAAGQAMAGCNGLQPARPVGGESPSDAGRRLFETARVEALPGTHDPDILADATTGAARPLLADYGPPRAPLAGWVISDDVVSARQGMFRAMKPAKLSDKMYMVPVLHQGRAVTDFELHLSNDGVWSTDSLDLTELDAGGRIPDEEEAVAKLHATLGPSAEVRTALLLPSGLVFAVGRSGEREAAVYLDVTTEGPGVVGFHKPLPETGALYTPEALATLLDPTTGSAEPLPDVKLSVAPSPAPLRTEQILAVG